MMTNLMTILERKAFISSNPRIVLSSCPPPCGHFSIQESASGGLSYKVRKIVRNAITARQTRPMTIPCRFILYSGLSFTLFSILTSSIPSRDGFYSLFFSIKPIYSAVKLVIFGHFLQILYWKDTFVLFIGFHLPLK